MHLVFEISSSQNWFWNLILELDFLSISNLVFTACVACKNPVQNRQKIMFQNQVCKLEISKIKCRSRKVLTLDISIIHKELGTGLPKFDSNEWLSKLWFTEIASNTISDTSLISAHRIHLGRYKPFVLPCITHIQYMLHLDHQYCLLVLTLVVLVRNWSHQCKFHFNGSNKSQLQS